MFTTNNHYQLHTARQSVLEKNAEKIRLIASLQKDDGASALRKRVGVSLIAVGQRLAEQPERELQLTFSS